MDAATVLQVNIKKKHDVNYDERSWIMDEPLIPEWQQKVADYIAAGNKIPMPSNRDLAIAEKKRLLALMRAIDNPQYPEGVDDE